MPKTALERGMIRKDGTALYGSEHYADIKQRAEKRFEIIDNLPPNVREIVHEYGWAAVKELLDLTGGKISPQRMVHVIKCCRNER